MQMRWLLSLTLLLLMAPSLIAQEDDTKKEDKQDEQTIAQRFEAIQDAQQKMMRDLGAEFRKAKTNKERNEVFAQRRKVEEELIEKANALVEEAGKTDESAEILAWTMRMGNQKQNKFVTKKLLEDYPESESLRDVAMMVPRLGMSADESKEILNSMIENSPHDSVKAEATMGLVSMLERKRTKSDEEAKEFEDLLDSIVEKYGDVKNARGQSYGEMAENKLFVIKYLSIGKVAPDIEGEDLDGKEFKLSDYRGKVVVLDFWGDW